MFLLEPSCLATFRRVLALALLATLAVASAPDRAEAVGDSSPLDFGEDDLEARLRYEVSRAPKGKLVWVKSDPGFQNGPFVRSPDSIWVVRTSDPGNGARAVRRHAGSPGQAELVELDAQGRELRAHSIGNSTSTPPVFGALGWIIGLKNGTVPMAWSPSGSMVWQGPHVNGARFLEPGPKGGVFVANGQGAMVRLDPRGRQLFSSFLGGGPVAAPLVLPGGSTASCLAGSGALVVLDGGGAVLFRDDGARCTASPSLHPGGDLYLPAQGGIRRYDSKGKLLGTVPLTGSLGRALLLPDGSMAVASSSGHLAMLSSKGRLLWTFPLGRASHPPWVQASPTGGLVTTSAVGYVLAINSRGRLSWSYHHPAQAQSAWVRLDGAVLLLYPGEGLRLITPPGPPRPGSEAARP